MDRRTGLTGSSCRRTRVLAVALVTLLVFSGIGAASAPEMPALQTGDVETDAVVLEAAVDEDGDARWSIEYRVALDDQNTTEAFESLQQDIEENTSDYRTQFASRMRSTVDAAENATGREMAVSNVTVSARTSPVTGDYGVVRYSFKWEGFAEVTDDRLAAGDALAGFFLDEDTELTISWPDGYVVDVVEPEPDRESENSVTWTGPHEFDIGQPRVVLRPENSLPPWGPLVGVVLFAAGGVVWYYQRRINKDRDASEPDEPGTVIGGEESTASAGAGDRTVGSGADQSEPDPGDSEAATSDSDAPTADTPEELLSPEERVLQLLEQNGGRMKQKAVTEELDWSAARTSQVVGDLRDEEKVESFRLGRENVLKFPDDEEIE